MLEVAASTDVLINGVLVPDAGHAWNVPAVATACVLVIMGLILLPQGLKILEVHENKCGSSTKLKGEEVTRNAA